MRMCEREAKINNFQRVESYTDDSNLLRADLNGI